MKSIRGGVTAPRGFVAAGVHCGVRKNKEKKDLAIILSERPCAAAAVYTTNRVIGQPIIVTKEHLANGVRSGDHRELGNANTCTGPEGLAAAYRMAELVAERLPVASQDVVVASTGVIGEAFDIAAIEAGMDKSRRRPLQVRLDRRPRGHHDYRYDEEGARRQPRARGRDGHDRGDGQGLGNHPPEHGDDARLLSRPTAPSMVPPAGSPLRLRTEDL